MVSRSVRYVWSVSLIIVCGGGCDSPEDDPSFDREGVGSEAPTELVDRRSTREVLTTEMAILSFTSVDWAPDAFAKVFRVPGNRWGVSAKASAGTVQVFDSVGRSAGSFGRKGEGPGEFGGVIEAVTSDGKLWVLDSGNARMTVVSETLAFEATHPLPGHTFSFVDGVGAGVGLTGNFNRPDGGTQAILAFWAGSGDEGVYGRYGGAVPVSAEPGHNVFYAAQSRGGDVWAVARLGGAVQVLNSVNGSSKGDYTIPSGPDRGSSGTQPATGAPPAEMSGVMRGPDGFVWVVGGAPQSDWNPETDRTGELNDFIDTWVLLIDTNSLAIVGEILLDEVCFPVADSVLSCVDETEQSVRLLALSVAD